MECVIVLPLYWAMLGGLFFLGEIAVNRVRMNVGDFSVTWMGGDRYGVNASDDASTTSDFGMDYLFQERFDSTGSYHVWQEQETNGNDGNFNRLNYYMSLYKGCVDFTVGVPDWILGMLFAQTAMTGSNDELSSIEESNSSETDLGEEGTTREWNDIREVDIFKGAKQVPKSYSFHRTSPDSLGRDTTLGKIMLSEYNRARVGGEDGMGWPAKKAREMLADGTLSRVLDDAWIALVGSSPISSSPIQSSGISDVSRVLWQFGEKYDGK